MMEQLTRIALIGTASHPDAGAVDSDHPAEALLEVGNAGDVESTFLLRAGVQALFAAAGYAPAECGPAIEPAPPDELTCGAGKLTGLLQNALAADAKDLLVEFLRQMQGLRLQMPHELLPEALDVTDAAIREELLPVLGVRGLWLSRFNPDWSWVESGVATLSGADRDALLRLWDEGSLKERQRTLAALRRSNPADARDRLAAVLPQEKADHRARLLEALETGLSADDEPLLESCLDDRSAVVRGVAAGLLSRLPQSQYVQRMQIRAETLLTSAVKGMLRKKLQLTCAPPEAIDKTWERDAIAQKPPAGSGKRAYWAETVLAAIPPGRWVVKFDAPPEALVAAIQSDPFADAVLAGWTTAATRLAPTDPDSAAWLAPLWKHWAAVADHVAGQARAAAFEQLTPLLKALPAPDAERLLAELLQAPAAADGHAIRLLAELPRPWTADFSGAYLKLMRSALARSTDNAAYQWANSLFVAGKALPRETFDAALADWELQDPDAGNWHASAARREIEKFLETIRLRQSFYQHVSPQ